MKPGQGIPEMTLATLKRIERLLETGVGFEPVLPPIVATGEEKLRAAGRAIEEDRGRDGYFSGVFGLGIPAAITIRWNPGTERLFPTTDQMAVAKSEWPEATEWDFSTLGRRGTHYFGIPLNFHQT